MAYGIGANDVANAMGTSVGSRALTLTQALVIAAIFGLPVSTTHAIIGAIAGFSVFYLGWSSVSWGYIGNITISWLITPLLAALYLDFFISVQRN